MLKRYRLLFVTFGGIAFIAAVMALGLHFEPRYLGGTEAPSGESQAKPEDQPARGDRTVTCHQDCQVHFGADQAPESVEGQEQAGKTKSESQEAKESREGLDLVAQQRMAYWSIWIAGFTLSGLMALFWTLVETRAAVREAEKATTAARDTVSVTRETGEAQVRAYVSAHKMEVRDEFFSRFTAVIKNSGQSPAKDVRVKFSLLMWLCEKENVIHGPFKKTRSHSGYYLASGAHIVPIFGPFRYPEEFYQWKKPGQTIDVEATIEIEGKDVFGKPITETFYFHETGITKWSFKDQMTLDEKLSRGIGEEDKTLILQPTKLTQYSRPRDK